MIHTIFLALALVQPSPGPADAGAPIIVTGTPLSSTARALESCLRRHCPPVEDINASIAHAENLFVSGDYENARDVLGGSIKRNGRYARQLPVEVADLHRSVARVLAHLGEGDRYRMSSIAMRRALRAGLPDNDPRVVGSLFDMAHMQVSLGEVNQAFSSYERAEQQAKAIGRPDIAAAARVRRAWLSHLAGDDGSAKHELRAIAGDADPAARNARITALVLLARIERRRGKTDTTDALVAQLREAKMTRAVLLYSPPVDLPRKNPIQSEGEVGSTLRLLPTDNFVDRWIDVGYWVQPSGRVGELEVLRKSGDSSWAAPLLKSIAGRIYAPLADLNGSYRVERYTYTSLWGDVTGSRLRQRTPTPRIEYLDLTAEPANQAAVPSSG